MPIIMPWQASPELAGIAHAMGMGHTLALSTGVPGACLPGQWITINGLN